MLVCDTVSESAQLLCIICTLLLASSAACFASSCLVTASKLPDGLTGYESVLVTQLSVIPNDLDCHAVALYPGGSSCPSGLPARISCK